MCDLFQWGGLQKWIKWCSDFMWITVLFKVGSYLAYAEFVVLWEVYIVNEINLNICVVFNDVCCSVWGYVSNINDDTVTHMQLHACIGVLSISILSYPLASAKYLVFVFSSSH